MGFVFAHLHLNSVILAHLIRCNPSVLLKIASFASKCIPGQGWAEAFRTSALLSLP